MTWFAPDDPFVLGAGQRVEQAVAAYRQARAACEDLSRAIAQARQQVAACEQGIIEARRQAFLQAHHADLLARLEAVRQDDPTQRIDAMHPRYYALHAQWRVQVSQVEAEIAEALQAIEAP